MEYHYKYYQCQIYTFSLLFYHVNLPSAESTVKTNMMGITLETDVMKLVTNIKIVK